MTRFSRRQLTSALVSALLWSALFTAFLFMPVQSGTELPVYKEIRIQLPAREQLQPDGPEPAEELPDEAVPEPEPEVIVLEEAAPEPVPEPVPVQEFVEAPAPAEPALQITAPEPAPAAPEPAAVAVAQEPAAAPKQVTPAPVTPEPAPAPAKAAAAKAAPEPAVPEPEPVMAPQKIVKSIDQLMAEQNAARGTKKSADAVDWDAMFGDSSTATSSTSTGQTSFVAAEGPSVSGTAASSSRADTGTASTNGTRTKDTSVDEGTASSLAAIQSASQNVASSTAAGSSATSAAQAGTGTAALIVQDTVLDWGTGTGRGLILPSKPDIRLTDKQKALVTVSVTDIRITFTVGKDGFVERGSISIDKRSSLPAEIANAIERQISDWVFDLGTSDGQAVLTYSIIKE